MKSVIDVLWGRPEGLRTSTSLSSLLFWVDECLIESYCKRIPLPPVLENVNLSWFTTSLPVQISIIWGFMTQSLVFCFCSLHYDVLGSSLSSHWLCCCNRLSGSERKWQQACSRPRTPSKLRHCPASCWRITYWPLHALSSSLAWTYRYKVDTYVLMHVIVVLLWYIFCIMYIKSVCICVHSLFSLHV